MRLYLCPILLATACSDYDLHRDDKIPAGNDTSVDPIPADPPDIEISPSALEFGALLKDCPGQPIDVTITNVGLGDLEISDISFTGNGNSAFSHNGPNTQTLATNESISLTIAFTPTLYLDYEVDLTVTSNDPDEGVATVPASGSGEEGAYFEEGFIQQYNPIVDVLWVIDNSGSMSGSLDSVQANFESFINEFTLLGLDYHMTVITTDMDNPDQSGKFQGPIFTSDMPQSQVVSEFLVTVDQGASGSGSERGFDAVKAALSEPLLSNENAGFLRPDASLSAIVVSDEDDDSSMSTTSFVSFFKGLKPQNTDLARFNALCGDRMGCTDFANGVNATPGTKYIDATEDTLGFFSSICASNYNAALQEISFAAAGMTVNFTLSQTPVTLQSVTVTVDGVVVAQDLNDGWTYDTTSNSITFHGDSIPGPDASVVVNYMVPSECN